MCAARPPSPPPAAWAAVGAPFAPFYLEELAPASPQPSFRPPGPLAGDRSPAAGQPNFACEAACAGPPARDLHVLFHGPSDPRPGTPCPRPVT